MKIEIDQSGKLENTNKPTVLAFSNSTDHSVIISSRDKKRIQKLFRDIGAPKIYIFKAFAVLIYILIEKYVKNIDQIIIDREYIGYEKMIKQYISEIFLKNGRVLESSISFCQIGKKSRAHDKAIKSYRANRADRRIFFKDFLRTTL